MEQFKILRQRLDGLKAGDAASREGSRRAGLESSPSLNRPLTPMFTGLVAGRGFVHDVRPEGVDDSSAPRADSTLRLTIQVPDDFGPPGTLGESVAINGCCLTAIAIEGNRWSFQAGSETLSKTNLGRLSRGRRVESRTGSPR